MSFSPQRSVGAEASVLQLQLVQLAGTFASFHASRFSSLDVR